MKTISQSLINDLTNPNGYCGYYLDLVYNKNVKTEPTDAMINGLFFEQELIGKTRSGEKIEIPKSKTTGKPLKRETDLLQDIKYAEMILQKNSITFDPATVQQRIEKDDRHGHIDCMGTAGNEEAIFDIKWTGMAFNQWEREFKWGDFKRRAITQSRHYQTLIDKKLPFIFLVFGSGWCRFFKVDYDEATLEHHKELATYSLELFRNMDYRPTKDAKLCFECRLRHVCDKINNKIELENFEDNNTKKN